MAEENINEISEIKDSNSKNQNSSDLSENTPDSQIPVDPNAASSGLKKASNLLYVFFWLGVILAIYGAILVFAYKDGWDEDAKRSLSKGTTYIIYGVADAITFYVFSKILIGLSVMTKASEEYLKGKK